jgi:alpha-tubulin suppressor-like RCC1 family protein
MAWGNSHDGQVGDGTHGNFTDHYSPVPTIGGSRWKSVSAGPGSTHALAVRTDGTLWAWGNGGNYRLGNNSTSDVTSPVQIGTETDWQFVSSGFNHSLAIKAGGTQLWAWGNNATHQLGDGTTIARTAPVQITSCSPSCPSAWQFISAGQNYSLAIGDGNLYVWGENTSHKLGNATGETNIPTKIVSCSPSCPLVWQAVSAGFSHSLGIGDGYLYAWGDRNNGKLGDGTPLVELPTPKKIGTDSWVAVSAGAEFSLGIQTDHTLWSWGSDASGQLGNGSVNSSDVTTPAQVTISALVDQGNWQSISAGSSHALAIKTNGSNRDLYAWGNNNHGQVASGDNPQVSPILISGNWQAASAGNTFSIGVRK